MKTRIQVFLLLVLFVMSGCSRSDASRITKVLDRCVEVSHRAAQYKGNPGAQANFVATEFQKIDVTSCPPDFREAFQAHIFAWQQAAPALANNTIETGVVEGVVAGVTGDPGYLGGASGNASVAVQQINASYYELTQIAAHYGARIPSSVVGN